jgi:hypothetical protein
MFAAASRFYFPLDRPIYAHVTFESVRLLWLALVHVADTHRTFSVCIHGIRDRD